MEVYKYTRDEVKGCVIIYPPIEIMECNYSAMPSYVLMYFSLGWLWEKKRFCTSQLKHYFPQSTT